MTDYGRTKQLQESIVSEYSKTHQIPKVSLLGHLGKSRYSVPLNRAVLWMRLLKPRPRVTVDMAG